MLERLLRGIERGDGPALADLYAEDAEVELPFALPEPRRLHGRDELRAHFAAARRAPLELSVRDLVVHETTDPEVIVAEFVYDGHVRTTGRAFTVSNVQLLRVRDGRIVASRDYHDHARLAEAVAARAP
ncbi:MAG TPA: nuclear transport factor 2 family protein [Gemmatimonadaceae bacterium]|nr:nuclear transport factor 2 family protein [Gemmatimonadaceae bacterium]